MKPTAQRWLALGLLAVLLASLGVFIVPAHWNSIWGDRDFTDWSVPIANRLHDGARLYTEGFHSPMPPLPFILPRLLFPRGGIWLDGNLLNYTFQSGMILLLFWAFSRRLGAGATFVTALAAIPVYLAMPKTMLYDSMAQFLVAAIGIAAAGFVGCDGAMRHLTPALSAARSGGEGEMESGFGGSWRRWWKLGVLAFSLALLLLTKQNTAVGALTGVSLLLLFLPRTQAFRQRCANLAVTLALTAVIFCAVALDLHHFLSFRGLIHDVFLTGSEPKGGPWRIIKSLVIYNMQIGVVAAGLYLLFYIFNACAGAVLPSWQTLRTGGWSRVSPANATPLNGLLLWFAALAATVMGIALAVHYARTGVSLKGTMMDNAWSMLVLNVGLCLVLLVILSIAFPSLFATGGERAVPLLAHPGADATKRDEQTPSPHDAGVGRRLGRGEAQNLPDSPKQPLSPTLSPLVPHGEREQEGRSVAVTGYAEHPLAPFALVFFCAMLFHNLSVMRLRWTVDNNPLVFCALALVVGAFVLRPGTTGDARDKGGGSWMPAILSGFLIFILWPLTHFIALNALTCADSWPEVRYLAGARLRPESKGMRELVRTVRSFAEPARKETVLLLPNDPNVESWFERDAPKLSSLIIFTDQYWDRYVDRDFAALQAHPPKVIVLGPRDYWRFFSRGWNVNRGAERLIDLVREKMLAKDYELKSGQPIAYQGGIDHMDVYVRRSE